MSGFLRVCLVCLFVNVLAGSAWARGGLDLPDNVIIYGQDKDPNLFKATAIVNGSVITDTDVEERYRLVLVGNGQPPNKDEAHRLRLQVLRNMIDEKLELQAAEKNKIEVKPAEIKDAIARIAFGMKKTPDQFVQFLAQNGASLESLRQQVRAELAWNRLLRRHVRPFVNVGEDEVEGVLNRLEQAKGTEQVHLAEIFLSATPATAQAVGREAERMVRELRGGANFSLYAQQYSQGASASGGGDIGYVVPAQLAPALRDALQGMPTGTIKGPIAVPGGFVILALVDRRRILADDPGGAVLSLKQIAVDFPPDIDEARAKKIALAVNEKTRNMGGCGRAEAVAKELGGQVAVNDRVRLSDLPDSLRTVVADLKVGEATPPFGSREEGVRVLVLCGRDDGPRDATGPSFDQIYAQMENERINRAAQRYLRDLRADAIIEYR